VAKSTRGKSKKAPEPAIAEEISEDIKDLASDESVEELADAVTETSEIPEDDSTPTDVAEAETIEALSQEAEPKEVEAPEQVDEPAQDPTPEVVRETVVERKGGFMPLVLGGVVAAGVGVASAEYIFPDGVPAAVGDLQGQIGAVVENVDGIETRLVNLEAQPRQDGSGISAAMEAELKDLRAALDVQKGELALMIEDAQSKKQSAEDTARQTLARSAVTRILVALDSGAPFADALADVEANTDAALPEALAQTAADGVPTLSALSDAFPDAARNALAAVRSEDTGGGVGSFFARQLGVRSVARRLQGRRCHV